MKKIVTSILILSLCTPIVVNAQIEEATSSTETKTTVDTVQIAQVQEELSYIPTVYGVVRAKWEASLYSGENRFNVRNSRLGVKGNASSCMKYAIQIDFNNEGKVSILDSYVNMYYKEFEFILGQQKYSLLTDIDRGPNSSFFANRSFLSKFLTAYSYSDGDDSTASTLGSRDIGALIRYRSKSLPIGANLGVFNGSGSNNPEWSTDLSYIARLNFGNAKRGFWGSASYYDGHSPASYIGNDGFYYRQDMTMYGAEVAYAGKKYRIEAAYAERTTEDVSSRKLDAAYILGYYKFILPEKYMANYISPVARYDYANGIDYATTAGDVDYFSPRRITLGFNLGFVSKQITSEIRVNYEDYMFTNTPVDYDDNPLFHDKITVEFVAVF